MKERLLTPAMKSVVQRTTTPIGEVLDVNGVLVKCIARPYVQCAYDACSGCYFSIANKTCPPSQCSSFGRTDGRNVWFVEVSKEDVL